MRCISSPFVRHCAVQLLRREGNNGLCRVVELKFGILYDDSLMKIYQLGSIGPRTVSVADLSQVMRSHPSVASIPFL